MAQKFEKLAEPIKIGPMVAKNRIWMSPLWSRYATVGGEVAQTLIDHYVARAKGGMGLITQEATAVDVRHVWKEPAIAIYADKFAPGLHRLVSAVHMYDVPIIVQLHHAGMFGNDPVAPSDVPAFDLAAQSYIQPRVLSLAEIEEIRECFIEAAVRAKEIGYDGVELHGSTAYLLEQFFSPHHNKRTDKYGGTLEGRMLLPLEIVRGIRQKCGADYPLGYTCVDCDLLTDGIVVEDAIAFAKALEREGVSYFDLQVTGTYETFHSEKGRGFCRRQKRGQFDISEVFKKELRIPVTARTAGEHHPEVWEDALKRGAVDAISVGRPMLADPDVAKKVLEGRVEDVRPCIQCDLCLEGGVVKIWQLECAVNYGLGRGEECVIQRVPVAKKVLVIGGGPGGLEAARVAALQGHDVTVMEKAAKLGGNVLIAALPIAKEQDLIPFIKWGERQCKKLGVKIELNKEVTLKVAQQFKPDAVIVATGATPLIPSIPGAKKSHVVTAADVLTGKATVKGKVVVAGGGVTGIETADFIIEKGLAKDVTVVEMLPMIILDMDPMNMVYMLMNVLPKIGLKVFTNMNVVEITDKSLVAIDKEWRRHEFEADTVVLSMGYTPNTAIYEALVGKVPELYNIGDSRKPRKIVDAIHEAACLAQQIGHQNYTHNR